MIKTNYNIKVSFACKNDDAAQVLNLIFKFNILDKDDPYKNPLTFDICSALKWPNMAEMQNYGISPEIFAGATVNEAIDNMICELTGEDLHFVGDKGQEFRYNSVDQKYKISKYDFVSKLVIDLLIKQVTKTIQQEIQSISEENGNA